MYLCEGQRQKLYLKSRSLDASNEEKQQEVVDAANAERLGYEVQAKNLSRLAKSVFSDLTADSPPTATINGKKQLTTAQKIVSFGNNIYDIIKNGKLTEFTDRLKQIPKSQIKTLSKGSQLVWKDILTDPDTKKYINEEISNAVSKGLSKNDEIKEIKQILVDYAAGGKEEYLQEIIDLLKQQIPDEFSDAFSEAFSQTPTVASSFLESFDEDRKSPMIKEVLKKYENKDVEEQVDIYQNELAKKIGKKLGKTALKQMTEDQLIYAGKILPDREQILYKSKLDELGDKKLNKTNLLGLLKTSGISLPFQ